MAAAQRRKTRAPRRRKPPARRRKPDSRKRLPKRRRKAAAGAPKRPYDLYVAKMLRQLHRDKVPMSARAKGALISYVRKVYTKVSSAAECCRKENGHCTIGARELQSALRRVMPKKAANLPAAASVRSSSP